MSTRIQLPDGSKVDIATDDPKAAAATARKIWDRKSAPKQSTWENFQDNVIDNVLPNWGDEIAGVGYGLGSVLSGKRPFGDGFREGQRRFKENQAVYKKEHPTLSTVSAGTGMGLGMVLPAGKALKGASMGRKVLQGAKIGAAYGAASGAGEGDSADLGRRANNAVHGAVSGGIVGAALPPAVAGGQRLGRAARQYVPGIDRVARSFPWVPKSVIQAATRRRSAPAAISAGEQQANRMAASRMRDGRIVTGTGLPGPQASPEAIQAELATRHAVGVPAMIADTTPALRDMAGWAGRGMGPGQTMVRERLAERKAAEGLRVRQHVRDTMPTVDDPIAFVQHQQAQAKAAAAPLYAEAYSQPMYRTEPIQAIEQTPAFRNAMPQTFDNIRNQIDPATGAPKNPFQMGFRDMPNAQADGLPPNVPHFPHPDDPSRFVAVDNGLSFEGYDQATRAMKASAEDAGRINPITGRVAHTSNSVHPNARADDLRGHLRAQNDPYDRAVAQYGNDMTYAQAFEQGGDIGKLTGHEVNAQARTLPQQAHPAYATGAGTAMADAASQYGSDFKTGDTANHVRKMLGDDVKQEAISDVAGQTADVRGLKERLEYEHQGHLAWQAVNGNSATPARQALDGDLNLAAGLPNPKRGWLGLANYVASKVSTPYQRQVRERVAEIATASDAQTVDEVMRAIAHQAEMDEGFADLLHRGGMGAAAAYGFNVAPIASAPAQ